MPDIPVAYQNRPVDSSVGTTINVDFSKDLTLDHESEVPLLALLSKLRQEATLTSYFKFAVDRFIPRTVQLNAAFAGGSGAQTVTLVASGTTAPASYFTNYDLCEMEQGIESATVTSVVYVVSVTNTTQLSVRAYDPNKTISAIPSGANFRKIGSTVPENASYGSGAYYRPPVNTVPTVYTQYIQTFEDYYSVSRIQNTNRQYTDPERSRLREMARKKHAVDQEYSMFLAKKITTTTNIINGMDASVDSTKPRATMSGLIEQLQTNVLSYGGALEPLELYNFMTAVHAPQYTGGNKRIVLASADLLASVNNLASSALRVSIKDTTWGPNITTMQFAGRVWDFVEAPILSEARFGWGVVIHPMFLKRRNLIPTTFEMNVQNPIDKFYLDGFYTATAIEARMEEIFGLIKP